MSEVERIRFRQDRVAGRRKATTYVMAPWPKRAEIAHSFLDSLAAAGRFVPANDQLTFSVKNGRATYSLGPENGFGARVGTLVDGSSYEPAPEPPRD